MRNSSLKDKGATIFVAAATIILAGIAVFTATRMYQLRQESISPASPESSPLATGENRDMTNVCHAINVTCDNWGVFMNHPADPFSATAEYKDDQGNWILAGEGQTNGGESPQNYLFDWNILTPPAGVEIQVTAFYNNREHVLRAGIMPECETPTSTPTGTPTSTPTGNPTNTPTNGPTNTPTDTPTNSPTTTPTPPVVLQECRELVFTLGENPTSTPTNIPTSTPTGNPTNTPTNGPTNTPTDTPTGTPTTPIGGPSATITPTQTLAQCNQTCTIDADCGGSLVCYKEEVTSTTGVCRNTSCTSDIDCSCALADTSQPELPPAGVGLPTIFTGALGVILLTLAFAFAL